MSSLPVKLEVGQTVGDYEILSLLGRGGMGRVFKVRNLISDRIEAMKVLLPDGDATPEVTERFAREIKLVAALEHPNIAALRTALRAGSQMLMVMEYVEGNSLEQMLQSQRPECGRAVYFMAQVLSALSYSHQHGVVHRDVKPSNVLMGADDCVKLTDFGIASRAGDPRLTGAGMALGSCSGLALRRGIWPAHGQDNSPYTPGNSRGIHLVYVAGEYTGAPEPGRASRNPIQRRSAS